MLVLSRHVNEAIIINGGDIEIRVVDVRSDRVRIGVSYPPHYSVHRKEIYDANRQAGAVTKHSASPTLTQAVSSQSASMLILTRRMNEAIRVCKNFVGVFPPSPLDSR